MKLLITADLHIDSAERAELLRRILQEAERAACGAVLIGGDLLDSPFPDPAVERAVLEAFGAPGCPVFLAAGNHDPLAATALYRRLPERVSVFPPELTRVPLGGDLFLWGYSYAHGAQNDHPLAGFCAPAGGVHILLAHGEVDNTGGFRPVTTAELAESGLTLAVLGHIHKPAERMCGGCRLLVPGTPEGRGWDETGDRYIYFTNGVTPPERRSVAAHTYADIAVDLTDCAAQEEILSRLAAAEVPPHCEARLTLTGFPTVDASEAARLYEAQTGRTVRDRTITSEPLSEIKEQNTLQGAFVRRALADIEAAPPERRPVLEEALRIGLRAIKEARL